MMSVGNENDDDVSAIADRGRRRRASRAWNPGPSCETESCESKSRQSLPFAATATFQSFSMGRPARVTMSVT